MAIKIIKNIILMVLVAVSQLSFVCALPPIFQNINVALAVIVFLCVAYNFSYGAVYCLCLSAVLDLFSFYPYGLQLICYLLTLLALFHLYIKVFTNKSLYSLLLLMIFGVVINELLLVFSHQAYLFYKTNTLSTFDWRIFLRDRILWQMALNCGLTVLIFIGFNVFSKNFKAVFIDTTRR